jgi:hypothetical protein
MSAENQTLHSTVRTSYPTVKHGSGGGNVIVWECFAASGPERLALIEGTMNSALCQRILQENVRPSVCELKLKRSWVMQQDIDLLKKPLGSLGIVEWQGTERVTCKCTSTYCYYEGENSGKTTPLKLSRKTTLPSSIRYTPSLQYKYM